MDYGRVAGLLAQHPLLALAPVHYLLGLLYTNFTLAWNPVMDILANYGNGMKRDLFWGVMGDKLRKADTDIKNILWKIQNGEKVRDEGRIDFINYRNHLWEILAKIPKITEAKNREVVPLLLDNFMKDEYTEITQFFSV